MAQGNDVGIPADQLVPPRQCRTHTSDKKLSLASVLQENKNLNIEGENDASISKKANPLFGTLDAFQRGERGKAEKR